MLFQSSLVVLFSVLPISTVLGKTLVPIRPGGSGRNSKRQEKSVLDLLSTDTFLWGDEGSETLRLR